MQHSIPSNYKKPADAQRHNYLYADDMAESRDLTGMPSKPNLLFDRDALKNPKLVDKAVGSELKPAPHSQSKPILPALGVSALRDSAWTANPPNASTASRPNLFAGGLQQAARQKSASAKKDNAKLGSDRYSRAFWESE